MSKLKVKITLTEEALGSTPGNEELLSTYIASRAPDAASMAEEIAAIGADGVEEKRMTVFPKMADGTPFMWDYQVKGFLKDAWKFLAKAGKAGNEMGKHCASVRAYKSNIDGLIFVSPRRIPYDMHGLMMGTCERSLRTSGPTGERTSIAKSETVPEGSTLMLEIECLDDALEAGVRECLDYGRLRGLSQWRNSGKGTFIWEEVK